MPKITFEFLPSTHTDNKKTIPQQRVIRKKKDSKCPMHITVTPKVPDGLKGKHLDERVAIKKYATQYGADRGDECTG